MILSRQLYVLVLRWLDDILRLSYKRLTKGQCSWQLLASNELTSADSDTDENTKGSQSRGQS